MKVGIITFYNVPNYGAVLQAYALQQVILSLHCECEIIDYKNEYFKKIYRPILLKDLKYKKFFVKKVLSIPKTLAREKKIERFVSEKIQLSPKEYRKEQLKTCNDQYDCFLAGSDQVWNFNVNGNDTSYFLDFVEDFKKKNSYAASYTLKDFSEEEKRKFRNLLISFNNISVRECEGVDLLEKLLQKHVSAVLDPTLLIDAEHWSKMALDRAKEPYVLVYLMSPDSRILDYAISFAKERNLQVKFISLYDAFGKKDVEVISDASVEEWLGCIKNAQYVIANSFHGIAFSILFKRNFMYALIHDAGKNTRISSMLNTLGITGRELDLEHKENNFTEMDYTRIDDCLMKEREKSVEFLKTILGKQQIKD